MSYEITDILDEHNKYYNELIKYIPADIINIVEQYTGGFVRRGSLYTSKFKKKETLKLNYTTFQLRYIHKLYFFDFWRVSLLEYSDAYGYNCHIWHTTYIYKNGTILSDRIEFIINNPCLTEDIDCMSFPVYDINKLKKEWFMRTRCTQEWVDKLNTALYSYIPQNINLLYSLFTETQHEGAIMYCI